MVAFINKLSFTTYTKVALVKPYDRKNALVSADMRNDTVLSFFETQEVRLLRILWFGTLVVVNRANGDGKVTNFALRSVSGYCFAGIACDQFPDDADCARDRYLTESSEHACSDRIAITTRTY